MTTSSTGSTSRPLRASAALVLVALALFYVQFGVQALVHYLPQGVLAVVGGVALGWSTVRKARGRPASLVTFGGTLPIALLHLLMTIEDSGELPLFRASSSRSISESA